MLSPYRVLDLTDEKGLLCGSVLGGLGADVIKIEKPGGDPARWFPPFYKDSPDPEKSLFWFAYNTNKRSVTLDITATEGREIFISLVKTTDIVVESFAPGYLDGLGLGYSDLNGIHPGIIFASITPYGQTGPYKDYRATDLIACAMGGLLTISGDPDRPPVQIQVPQSYCHASMQAAMGTLIALYHREVTGEGQHIDVSMQESIVRMLLMELPFWEYDKFIMKRSGGKSRRGHTLWSDVFPCKDGYVSFRFTGGQQGRGIRPLVEWMNQQGMGGALASVDPVTLKISEVTQEQVDSFEKALCDFFARYTCRELYREALKRRIYLMPSNRPDEIRVDEQLSARDYWIEVEHPELGASIIYPGAPYQFTGTPWKIKRHAPGIGEHNREIYEELGLAGRKIAALRRKGII